MKTREKELEIYLKSVLYKVRGHEVYSEEVVDGTVDFEFFGGYIGL